MTRGINRLGFLALALAAGSVAAYGQSSTTGSLYGVITDDKGNPVVGATVRITSAQITRTETTGATGAFRFGLLNPGAWTISVSKAGFQTATRSLTVQTNTNHQANMKLANVAGSTVEVVASQVAAVDLTTTQTGSSYTMEAIQAIPMGRDMNSIANFTPGVTNSGFAGLGASISGASGAENSYVLDGLTTNDFRYGGIGNTLVTDFVDQVEVQTGGFKPEFSALGGVFNVVTKAGTNDFKGSSWFTFDPKSWAVKGKRNDAAIQGDPLDRYDVGAEVSGAIIKDKLFYFVGLSADIRKDDQVATNNSGFTGSGRDVKNYQFVTKLNYFLSQDMQFTLFFNRNPNEDKIARAHAVYGDGNLGRTFEGFTQGINVSYDWTITPNLIFSAKLGQNKQENLETPSSNDPLINDRLWFWNGGTNVDAIRDLPGGVGANGNSGPQAVATPGGAAPGNFIRGGYGLYTNEWGETNQFKADLSWFVGNHNLKAGIAWTDASYRIDEGQTGGNNLSYTLRASASSSTGFYVRTRELSNNAEVKTEFQAIYLQDTWEVVPGIKFAFGARLESQNLKDSHGRSFLKFGFDDAVQPRIGFIWDVNNDAKTKVSANYALYYQTIPQRVSIRQRANEIFLDTYYPLTNYNGGVGIPVYDANAPIWPSDDFSTPFSYIPIMKGIKLPKREEWVVGIDHTLANGWMVGMHAKYRELRDPIEDFTPYEDSVGYIDRGTYDYGQAILGNPGPGMITWRTTATSESRLSDGIDSFTWDSIYPEAFNIYQAVDFTLDKKTSDYYISMSYTWSRLYGSYEGVVSSSNGQSDGNITASWDYPNYVGKGLLPLDRTHVAKFIGSRTWTLGPGRLTAGAFWTYQSGTPISLLDDGSTSTPPRSDQGGYGNQVPQDGKFGQFGRIAATQNTDVRLEYDLKIGKLNIVPSVQVLNVFNTRQVLGVFQNRTDQLATDTGNWGKANDWQTGRAFRFGVKVRF